VEGQACADLGPRTPSLAETRLNTIMAKPFFPQKSLFHISYSLLKIKLHTKNQFLMLFGSALKIRLVVVVWCGLTNYLV
jgi:hypothetical protein